VSASDGPMPQTREHILLAKQVGVPAMVVFLNKCDLVPDPDMISLIELEVKDLLKTYEFDAENTKFVAGSATEAMAGKTSEYGVPAILALMNAVDENIPTPSRPLDKPFLMPIEGTFVIGGRGTVATGAVQQGQVKVGDELEIVGLKAKPSKTTCTGVEMFRKLVDVGQAGDNLGLLLKKLERDDVKRGMVVAKPNTLKAHSKFEARLYVLTEEEGGRKTAFHNNYRPQIFIRTADVTGAFKLPPKIEMVMPGDTVNLTVELIAPLPIHDNLRFSVREGGRTVGYGVITKVLP